PHNARTPVVPVTASAPATASSERPRKANVQQLAIRLDEGLKEVAHGLERAVVTRSPASPAAVVRDVRAGRGSARLESDQILAVWRGITETIYDSYAEAQAELKQVQPQLMGFVHVGSGRKARGEAWKALEQRIGRAQIKPNDGPNGEGWVIVDGPV